MSALLWALALLLVAFWLIGFALANLGSAVHLLLLVALMVLAVNIFTGRRRPI